MLWVISSGPCQPQTTDGLSTGQSSSTEKNIIKPGSTGKIISFSQKFYRLLIEHLCKGTPMSSTSSWALLQSQWLLRLSALPTCAGIIVILSVIAAQCAKIWKSEMWMTFTEPMQGDGMEREIMVMAIKFMFPTLTLSTNPLTIWRATEHRSQGQQLVV